MFDKLKDVAVRYEQINEKLMDPAVITDNNQYKNLMKEHKNLTPIVEKFREYEKAREAFEEAKMLLDEGGLDPFGVGNKAIIAGIGIHKHTSSISYYPKWGRLPGSMPGAVKKL